MVRLAATDGLRGVAVLLVVLFHTFPALLPGGFIGVDVFFVISGFVIARRYLFGEWVGAGEFFARRVRRLVPAYAVMVLAVTAAAYFVLTPKDLYNFGKSLAAQAVYMQNVAFWIEGTYFEPEQVKPLLHTWTLAVEEQFYLLLPLLVLAYRRGFGGRLLIGAAILSVAAGLVIAGDSPKTAFFLLPARVWEFAAGIAAAGAFGRLRPSRGPVLAGLALILAAAFLFDEAASFPGPQAILAVAGAALICLYQGGAGVLTAAPLQAVGRMSYSLYLWHWPPVVFLFAITGEMPGALEGMACIALAFVLGWASWRWVENGRPLRLAFPALAAFLGFAAVSGGALYASSGALARYPAEERALYAAPLDRVPPRCGYIERLKSVGSEICRLNEGEGPGLLILGDSHAARVAALVSEIGRAAGRPVYIVKASCTALDCSAAVMSGVIAEARALGVADVLLTSYWAPAATAGDYHRALRPLQGFAVHLVKAVPASPYFDPVLRANGERAATYSAAAYDRDYARQNAAFETLRDRVRILDPVPYICPGECRFSADGKPLYLDTNHLTTAGVETLRPMFAGVFNGAELRSRVRS